MLVSQKIIETMESERIIQSANLSTIKTNIEKLWRIPKLFLPRDVFVSALMLRISVV